jgi:Carboxypeptidase regulatory-like domain
VFVTARQQVFDGMMFGGGGAPTRSDGTFELSGITPGDYSIDVRPTNPNPGSGNEPEMASANVTVTGQDISGLTLVMSKGGSARGQIVFDDGKVPQSVRPSAVRLFANSTSFAPMTIPGRSSVKDDWSFEIAGISGERLIRAQLPPGWALKSVIYDGSNVTDRAIDFGTSGELAGLQIVLTQRQTDLSGTVVDLRGNPIKDYVVVVFAEDSVHWVPQTRFIRTSRPDQDGRFAIRGLPPERYLAVAVEYLEPGEETSPETLEQLKSMATSLSLAEGETRTAELKLSAF